MAQLKINDDTHRRLRELARSEGVPMQVVLNKALAQYQKKKFFDSLGAAFSALKNDPKAWSEERKEREAWANTLLDNTRADEIWKENGVVVIDS